MSITRRGLLVGASALPMAMALPMLSVPRAQEQPCMLMGPVGGDLRSLGVFYPKSQTLVEFWPWEEGMPMWPKFDICVEPTDPALVRAKYRMSQATARRWLRME